ncbi:MAG: hypothetical protein ACLPXT_04505 [Terracidiphilus sp.]
MQTQAVVVVVLLSVTVGAGIGVLTTVFWHNWRSKRFRSANRIPDLIGQWRCKWFDDAKSQDQPKVEDTVEILKWTTQGQFLAVGHQPQFQLSYPIMGEIDPSRVVTLAYKAARYPFEPNRGVACLELSRDGKTMEGHWYGRRSSTQLGGGRVSCSRL